VALVRMLLRQTLLVMLAFVALVALTGWSFTRLPTGFLPTEDQGYAIVGIQLPDAASQARTRAVVTQVESILKKTPGIATWVQIGGNSILDSTVASNAATMYVIWKPWEERSGHDQSQEAILGKLRQQFQGIEEAIVFTFPPSGHPRARSGRWLPDPARGPRRRRTLGAPGGHRRDDRRRQFPVGPARPQHNLPRGGPPTVCRHRPGQGQEPRHPAQRHLRHAASLARLGLCQRLQQVRPHLPGPGPGGRAVPQATRRHQAARGPGPERGHDPPGHDRQHQGGARAADHHAL